ncbi:MAG TPA: methyltransferase domain-containing protein [bacterium]|nr:methyltransferase domain-containing protein [bacterium]
MSDERAKRRSRTTFDRLAANYENTLAGWHSRRMKEAALQRLGSRVHGPLLDIGCGPGLLLQTLAERDPAMFLAGLDISPEMIRIAKEGLGPRADLRVGDAETLPWEGARFDCLVCVDSFHHYPHPQAALAEMHRVLRSGGRLVVADPTAPPIIRQLANIVNPLLGMGDVRMYGPREMKRMLEAQGFEQVEWSTVGIWGFVATAVAG